MKRYVAIVEIKDGEYEYYSTCQHQIDEQELNKSEDWEQYALKDILGHDLTSSNWSNWYESQMDYRMYRLYSLKEITEPDHAEVLKNYGIF